MTDVTKVLPFNLILFDPAVLKFQRIELPLPLHQRRLLKARTSNSCLFSLGSQLPLLNLHHLLLG